MILLLVGLVLLILSIQQLRVARRNPYWRQRRAAGQRGGQLFLVALTLLGLGLGIGFLSGLATIFIDEFDQLINPRPTSFPGIAPTITPNFPTPDVEATFAFYLTATAQIERGDITAAPTHTATATATLTSTATASNTPTATRTFTALPPTATPTATLSLTPSETPAFQITPPPSEVEPHDDAAINISTLGYIPDTDSETVFTDQFDADVRRIYVYIAFENMTNGVTWTRILYRDGIAIQGGVYTWSDGEAGNSFFFFGQAAGYPPGSYTIQLFIGDQPAGRTTFTITASES